MFKYLCNEITVKFTNNRQGELIRFSDSRTAAKQLQVIDDGVRLTVAYLDKDGNVIETIAYPMHSVGEYHCREIASAHQVKEA